MYLVLARLIPHLSLQIDAFSETLKEHQKAITADGSTVLQKAMIEHNLQAASRLYTIMYFSELGQLLSVSTLKAEKIAAQMIAEKRLTVYTTSSLLQWTLFGCHFLNHPDVSQCEHVREVQM